MGKQPFERPSYGSLIIRQQLVPFPDDSTEFSGASGSQRGDPVARSRSGIRRKPSSCVAPEQPQILLAISKQQVFCREHRRFFLFTSTGEYMTRIPLNTSTFGDEETNAVLEVLRSSRVTMGGKCREFKRAFGEYLGGAEAIFRCAMVFP